MNPTSGILSTNPYPSRQFFAASACCITGVVLIALGGPPLFSSSILNAARISLLASGGFLTLTSLFIFALAVRDKKHYDLDVEITSYLHSRSDKISDKAVEKVKTFSPQELHAYLIQFPKTLPRFWDLKVVSFNNLESILYLPNIAPALKELCLYFYSQQISPIPQDLINYCLDHLKSTDKNQKMMLFKSLASILKEIDTASKQTYELLVVNLLTSKLPSRFKIDFLQMELQEKSLSERLNYVWEVPFKDTTVRILNPSLMHLSLSDVYVLTWVKNTMPNSKNIHCVVSWPTNEGENLQLSPLELCKFLFKGNLKAIDILQKP